jgi:hypothetical protein
VFDSNHGGREARAFYAAYQDAFSAPVDAAAIAAARVQLASKSAFRDLTVYSMRFTDYPGDEAFRDEMAILFAKVDAAISRVPGVDEHKDFIVADGGSWEEWKGTTPDASPLQPFYKWVVDGLAKEVEANGPVANYDWAAFYEDDPAVLDRLASGVGIEGIEGRRLRMLLGLRATELAFLKKLGDETVVVPIRGDFGESVRDLLRQQREVIGSKERKSWWGLAMGLLVQAGGVAVATGSGDQQVKMAGLELVQRGNELALNSFSVAEATMRMQASQIASIISEKVGPIRVELEGQAITITVISFPDLRTKLRDIYQQNR